jgi:predicted nucleic acid-binding protein
VLRRREAQRELDARRVRFALQDLADLPMLRYPQLPFACRIWELRDALTAYDAAYVALAEELGCALVTTDRRLSGSPAPRCAIELVIPR